MAIYKILEKEAFGPDEIKAMTTAYEDALKELRLADRTDPVTEIIAKAIIDIARTGEKDPEKIRERAISTLGVPRQTGTS